MSAADFETSNDVDRSGPDLDQLGARLRAARLGSGMSMRKLARESGVSQPFLSQLESGQASPSLTTLFTLAAALGAPPEALLAEGSDVEPNLVAAGTGATFRVTEEDDRAVRRVVAGSGPFTASEYLAEPGADLGGFHASAGVELIVVVEGALQVELAEVDCDDVTVHRLEAGDSLHYPTTVRHRWAQVGPGRTRFLHVLSTG